MLSSQIKDLSKSDRSEGNLKITLISLHGLIRTVEPELGKDSDTGGQIKYVLELAEKLAQQESVREVELLTRQVIDSKIDSTYSQIEESISEKAKIVRIPFGPNRYLKKESLWPYLEMFVDQAIQHFKRSGLPDVIHGHYADAGYVGSQLASLLHVPFIFTGHSLGRVKRERLISNNANEESLEKKYKFTKRIEAEEVSLETASLVVTSTHQEVEEQYSLYDHYDPARMEVIPPGVNLNSFSPVTEDWTLPEISKELNRFLNEPKKPIILTLARPDERKNLEMLVKVYGESEELQKLSNLVILMGTRNDIRELPKSQQSVINNILYLIDKHDLYGKVAYPKGHGSEDVPELYRLAEHYGGVFINPALTEPFGLTLLEAGACGLPLVATNDGGPRDIIANCQNGILIDPFDSEDITRALLHALTEDEKRQSWKENGIIGTRKYYSWENHVKRYLRVIEEIVQKSSTPVLKGGGVKRRLPSFDRLIITDLDNTLTGDWESLEKFKKLIAENENVGFGIATGRRLDRALKLLEEINFPRPDLIDSDCGTKIHYGDKLTEDSSWRKQIDFAWKPEQIKSVLKQLPGLVPQSDKNQSDFKISYNLDPKNGPSLSTIKKILRESKLRAKVVMSMGVYIDIIPVRGGSDLSLRHVLWKWGFSPEQVLVAGDSGNDAGMLLGRTLGVVVANHSKELDRIRKHPRIYFAKSSHARGILEGIEYYNFLDRITIPNDRIE